MLASLLVLFTFATDHPDGTLRNQTPHEATNSAYELLDKVAENHRHHFNTSTIAQFKENARAAMKKQQLEVAAAKEREVKAEEERGRAEEETDRVQAAFDAQALELVALRARIAG